MRPHKFSLTIPAEQVIGAGAMVLIKARCTKIESGGRMIDAILTNTLLPELSLKFLNKTLEGRVLSKVTVGGGMKGSPMESWKKLGSAV